MCSPLLPTFPCLSKEWLTEQEVSVLTGLSRSTLQKQRFFKREGIAYSKLGRSVRYRKSDVEAFMEARKIVYDKAN